MIYLFNFALILFSSVAYSGEYDDLGFDVESFEKKTIEFKGYARIDYTFLDTSVRDKQTSLNEFNLQTDIDKYVFDIHNDLSIYYKTDSITKESSSHFVLNSLTQTFGEERFSLEVGKKVERWGKGYSYNSLAFFERQKDPIFPELAREGFWMGEAQMTKSLAGSAIKNYTLTVLGAPRTKDNDYLFSEGAQSNYGAKIYLLIWDIDFDLIVAKDSYGTDLSLNLVEGLEVHGEYGKLPNSESYLLGFRYQSIIDTTIVGEYVDTHQDGRFHYLKVTQKEPFNWVYSNVYLLYTKNTDDDSYRSFLGVNYDFKNGLVLDGSLLKNTQGKGIKALVQYFF